MDFQTHNKINVKADYMLLL